MSAGLTWLSVKEADRTGCLSRIEAKIAEDSALVATALRQLDLPTTPPVSSAASELHIGRLSPRRVEISGSAYFLKEDAGCYAAMEAVRSTLNGTRFCIIPVSKIKIESKNLVIQREVFSNPPCIPNVYILEKVITLCLFMAMFNINDGVSENIGWIDGNFCIFDLETCFQPTRIPASGKTDRLNLLISRTGILETPGNIVGIGMFRGSVAESLANIWDHLTDSEIRWSVGRAVARALSDLGAIPSAATILSERYIRPRVAIRPTATYGLLCNRELTLQRLFASAGTERYLKPALQLLPAWPKGADFSRAIDSEVEQIMMGGLPIFHSRPETTDLLFGDEIVANDFFAGSAVSALKQTYDDLTDRDLRVYLEALLVQKVTVLRDYYSSQNLLALSKKL